MSKGNWNWNYQKGGSKPKPKKGGRGNGGGGKPISVLAGEDFDRKLVSSNLDVPFTIDFFQKELESLEKNNPLPTEKIFSQMQKYRDAIAYGRKKYGIGSQEGENLTTSLQEKILKEKGLTENAAEVKKNLEDYISDRKYALTNVGTLITDTDNDLEKIIVNYQKEAEKTLGGLRSIKDKMSKINFASANVIDVVNKNGEAINDMFEINKQLDSKNKELQKEKEAAIEMSNRPLVSTSGRLCKSLPFEKKGKWYCKIEPYKTLFGSKEEDTIEQSEYDKWVKRGERQKTGERIVFITFENVDNYIGRNVFTAQTVFSPKTLWKIPKGRERKDAVQVVTNSPSIPINTEFELGYNNGRIEGTITPAKIREFISDSAGWDFYNEIKNFDNVVYEFNSGVLYATNMTNVIGNLESTIKQKEDALQKLQSKISGGNTQSSQGQAQTQAPTQGGNVNTGAPASGQGRGSGYFSATSGQGRGGGKGGYIKPQGGKGKGRGRGN